MFAQRRDKAVCFLPIGLSGRNLSGCLVVHIQDSRGRSCHTKKGGAAHPLPPPPPPTTPAPFPVPVGVYEGRKTQAVRKRWEKVERKIENEGVGTEMEKKQTNVFFTGSSNSTLYWSQAQGNKKKTVVLYSSVKITYLFEIRGRQLWNCQGKGKETFKKKNPSDLFPSWKPNSGFQEMPPGIKCFSGGSLPANNQNHSCWGARGRLQLKAAAL